MSMAMGLQDVSDTRGTRGGVSRQEDGMSDKGKIGTESGFVARLYAFTCDTKRRVRVGRVTQNYGA